MHRPEWDLSGSPGAMAQPDWSSSSSGWASLDRRTPDSPENRSTDGSATGAGAWRPAPDAQNAPYGDANRATRYGDPRYPGTRYTDARYGGGRAGYVNAGYRGADYGNAGNSTSDYGGPSYGASGYSTSGYGAAGYRTADYGPADREAGGVGVDGDAGHPETTDTRAGYQAGYHQAGYRQTDYIDTGMVSTSEVPTRPRERRARVSWLAVLGLLLGVAGALASVTGELAPLGLGIGLLGSLFSFGGLVATGRKDIASRPLAVVALLANLTAIGLAVMAFTGQFDWLNRTNQPGWLRDRLNEWIPGLERW